MKKRILSLMMVLVFIMTLMPSTIVPTIAEDVGGFIENALAEDIGVYEYISFPLDSNSEIVDLSNVTTDKEVFVKYLVAIKP